MPRKFSSFELVFKLGFLIKKWNCVVDCVLIDSVGLDNYQSMCQEDLIKLKTSYKLLVGVMLYITTYLGLLLALSILEPIQQYFHQWLLAKYNKATAVTIVMKCQVSQSFAHLNFSAQF